MVPVMSPPRRLLLTPTSFGLHYSLHFISKESNSVRLHICLDVTGHAWICAHWGGGHMEGNVSHVISKRKEWEGWKLDIEPKGKKKNDRL